MTIKYWCCMSCRLRDEALYDTTFKLTSKDTFKYKCENVE